MYKLREDVRNIREELAEYVNSPNSSTFDVCEDHSEISSDSNNDDISSDDDAFEDIEYVEASLPDSELVSLEEENVSLNDNPTPDRMLNSSTSFLIFEESDNSLSISDNSSLEFETLNDQIEDTRSGSTTTHANNSISRDIYFLEELLVDDFIPLPKNELSDFDHNNPSFPRPPPEPPDVEFDFEPNSEEVISAVINNINELYEDECFEPGREIDVFSNIEDDDYFPFMFVIQIFLPYLIYPEVSSLLLSAESEDTIFDTGISV
nr:hypothetical protein [Tanacetum cinerariifolium]